MRSATDSGKRRLPERLRLTREEVSRGIAAGYTIRARPSRHATYYGAGRGQMDSLSSTLSPLPILYRPRFGRRQATVFIIFISLLEDLSAAE